MQLPNPKRRRRAKQRTMRRMAIQDRPRQILMRRKMKVKMRMKRRRRRSKKKKKRTLMVSLWKSQRKKKTPVMNERFTKKAAWSHNTCCFCPELLGGSKTSCSLLQHFSKVQLVKDSLSLNLLMIDNRYLFLIDQRCSGLGLYIRFCMNPCSDVEWMYFSVSRAYACAWETSHINRR